MGTVEILDAPWIREAENNGLEEAAPVYCPCCHEECEQLFVSNGDVLGCEHCVTVEDAYDWMDIYGRDEA